MNPSNASALVLSVLTLPMILGCSGSSASLAPGSTGDPFQPATTGGQPPLPTDALFVLQPSFGAGQYPSHILEFPRSATGNTAPAAQITGPPEIQFMEIAANSAGDLFVQGFKQGATPFNPSGGPSHFDVYIYPAGATANATPAAIIPNTNASALCVDAAGKLYTTGFDGIRIYDPSAPSTPLLRTIALAPRLNSAAQITTDADANIYLLTLGGDTGNAVVVLSGTATGSTAPLATLSGPATGLINPQGLAVDSAGNMYVGAYDSATLSGSILVFAAGSTGDATPLRIISGPDTRLGPVRDLRVDRNGTLFVNAGRPGPVSFTPHILSFAPGANGDALPLTDLAPAVSAANNMVEDFGPLAIP